MPTITGLSGFLGAILLACATMAAPPAPICGEWTGSRPPRGYPNTKEQKWILTFRQDQSFALTLVEGTIPVPGFEGRYRASASNVVLQLPRMPPVTVTYSIQDKNLKIAISDLTTMLGSGPGVDTYVRTKEVTELAVQTKQKLLQEGRYALIVNIAKDNDDAVLKATFGEQYKSALNKPIDGGTYSLYQLQDRNILRLSAVQFGPPEFNGDSFKVFGRVAPQVAGDFSGTIVSPTKVEGTLRDRDSTLHGTFTLERVGDRE